MKLTLHLSLLKVGMVLVINMMIFNTIVAQNTSVCPIGVGTEPKQMSTSKSTEIVNEVFSPNFMKWNDLKEVKYSDDKKAKISLPGIKRSRLVLGNNFNFNLPEGSIISGITLMIEGQSTNYNNISEIEILLLGKDGIPKGQNKANAALGQKAWSPKINGSDGFWMYGSSTDTWGQSWTREEINNSDFGFQLQLRNIDDGNIDLWIDKIEIIVHYQPLYSFCDANCLTFYIDKYEQMGSYVWQVPEGFRMVSAMTSFQAIDLKITHANYGVHKICVDVFDKSGKYFETCCRNFLYQDCSLSEIKGLVWLDINNNKLRDPIEGFLSNVSIKIFKEDGSIVDSTLTNANGVYRFKNLEIGKYYIKAPVMSDKLMVLYNALDPDLNSDITNAFGIGSTDLIQTIAGTSIIGIDLGYTPIISIGDYVWADKNYNGLQDVSEIGIKGVSVALYNDANTFLGIQLTDSVGGYKFTNLPADKYYLKFEMPAGYYPTFKNPANNDNNSKIDSTGTTSKFSFITAGFKNNMDAGYFQQSNIGDYTWEDKNGNGIQDSGEQPLANVQVLLTGVAGDGSMISLNTTSNAQGKYAFLSIKPGKYSLKFIAPNNYISTKLKVGQDSLLDNNANMGIINDIIILSGETRNDLDAGFYQLGEIGDYVWEDKNANGIQDNSEVGMANVSLKLGTIVNGDTVYVSNTFSDSLGKYAFKDVHPGKYFIQITLMSNYVTTLPITGLDPNKDSNAEDGFVNEITIMSGEISTTYDIGLFKTGSIGDMVYEDLNCNGIKDIGEMGLAGIEVTIDGSDLFSNIVVRQTVTEANGNYLFSDLNPGSYTVYFSVPAGYEFSAAMVNFIMLQSGENYLNADAPLFRRATIGDFVWVDLDNNGLQDLNEPGLANVRVTLRSVNFTEMIVKDTLSDSNGQYIFNNLKPGTYNLEFETPLGYKSTLQHVGQDNQLDSDIDSLGNITNIIVISGANGTQYDAGYQNISNASIGDFVWEDLNANGVQDPNEIGIPNVKILLKGMETDGSIISEETITDSNGRYNFFNLGSGSYVLEIEVPALYFLSNLHVGTDNNIDSDFDLTSFKTQTIVIGVNSQISNVDAGLYRLGSLGDFVWKDINENGLFDSGEIGIEGIELTLKDENEAIIASTISDTDGIYKFTDLTPAKYLITASLPSKYKLTILNAADETKNSDFTDVNGIFKTDIIQINSGVNNSNIDLGLIKVLGSQSGFVWMDSNGDGIYTDLETKLDSISVVLLNTLGDTIGTTMTDSLGNYAFLAIESGMYRICFETPTNMLFTLFQQGSDATMDSDVTDKLVGKTATFEVVEGINKTDISAGLVRYSTIGDYVWVDTNEDGFQDSDEEGLNGIHIYLYNEAGEKIDSTISGLTQDMTKSGYYAFENKEYGRYSVKFELPENFEFTFADGQYSSTNSDVVSLDDGGTNVFMVAPNQDRLDIDAGYILMADMGGNILGIVWQDANNNKLRDTSELLLSDIPVSLYKMGGVLIETQNSLPDGSYAFMNIPFGDYYLSVAPMADKVFVLYSGISKPFDSDITNQFGIGTTRLVSVFPGMTVSDIDIGLAEKLSIGDFVWDDLNNNGLQDIGEPGIGQITVRLINKTGEVIATTMTTTDGKYKFSDVPVGEYSLSFSKLTGYVFSDVQDSDIDLNSDADINGLVPLTDFSIPGDYKDIDVAYVKTSKIGDVVWLDLNGNGFFQAGEPGIANVKIKLFTPDGMLVDSTFSGPKTGNDFVGFYEFKNVRPSNYYIKFEIPSSYVISDPFVGDEDNDSNITNANGPLTTDIFVVAPNQNITNIDAAAYEPATLGDRVWEDLNKDGVQDTGEPGLENVTVSLYTQSGFLVESTMTDSLGFFSFIGLRQRLYYLQFTILEGYEFTGQNISGNGSTDSDVDETGTTPLISLAHGSTFLDVDAGMFLTSRNIVMGTVWNDVDEDGIRIEGEQLAGMVNVHLKDTNQNIIASTKTNHAGMYALITEKTGDHNVLVEAPADNAFTAKGIGPDRKIDSDVNKQGISDMMTLNSEYEMQYVDAGYFYKVNASITGLVWVDTNESGKYEKSDEVLPNTLILLFNKFNIFVKSTKTDATGSYTLKNLEPGQYYCMVPVFPEMDFIMYTGQNPAQDSEITNQFGLGTSRMMTLSDGFVLNNFDFGYKVKGGRFVSPENREVKVGEIEIYPNPSLWHINVSLSTSDDATYLISNTQGAIVEQGKISNGNKKIDIDHLPNGRYVLHVLDGINNASKTFIKIKN